MPELIETPSVVTADGSSPKRIEEHAGRVRTSQEALSVARMRSPEGWGEPESEEITTTEQGRGPVGRAA